MIKWRIKEQHATVPEHGCLYVITFEAFNKSYRPEIVVFLQETQTKPWWSVTLRVLKCISKVSVLNRGEGKSKYLHFPVKKTE